MLHFDCFLQAMNECVMLKCEFCRDAFVNKEALQHHLVTSHIVYTAEKIATDVTSYGHTTEKIATDVTSHVYTA